MLVPREDEPAAEEFVYIFKYSSDEYSYLNVTQFVGEELIELIMARESRVWGQQGNEVFKTSP